MLECSRLTMPYLGQFWWLLSQECAGVRVRIGQRSRLYLPSQTTSLFSPVLSEYFRQTTFFYFFSVLFAQFESLAEMLWFLGTSDTTSHLIAGWKNDHGWYRIGKLSNGEIGSGFRCSPGVIGVDSFFAPSNVFYASPSPSKSLPSACLGV